MRTSSARPSSRDQPWWLNGVQLSYRRRRGRQPRRLRPRTARVRAARAHADQVHVASEPRDQGGRSRASPPLSPAASTIAAAPSVTGAVACAAVGAYIGRASSSSTDSRPCGSSTRSSPRRSATGWPPSAIARSSQAPGVDPRPRPPGRPATRCRPTAGHRVRLELQREGSGGTRRPRTAEGRRRERSVDLAGLDLPIQASYSAQARSISTWDSLTGDHADRVDGRPGRERPTREVVGGPGAPEPDVVAGPAGLLVALREQRDQHLHARGRPVELGHLPLGEPDDCNVSSSRGLRSAGQRWCR